jgi:hypothetical protein
MVRPMRILNKNVCDSTYLLVQRDSTDMRSILVLPDDIIGIAYYFKVSQEIIYSLYIVVYLH